MKKLIALLVICISAWNAQAQLCEPSENCFEPQVFCGAILNGYAGMTPPPTGFPLPIPTFCGTIENPQWFGFVPCESTVSFDIVVGNCTSLPPEVGLQAAIMEADECAAANTIACTGQIFPNTTGQIEAGALEPGQVYFLFIDGYSGDICDYEIFINQGVNPDVPVLAQTAEGYIDGPTSFSCGGGTADYTAILPECEAQNAVTCETPFPAEDCLIFNWTLPPGAAFVGDSTTQTVTINFSGISGGPLQVEPVWDEASCGSPDCYCEWCPVEPILPLLISIDPLTTNVLPPLEVCENENFQFCGATQTATENETLTCQNGCETTIQEVVVLATPSAHILQTGDLENDPFVLLENEHFTPGTSESYFWEGPGIGIGTAGDFTQEVTQPGIFTLTVTNLDSGCTAQAQTVVLPGAVCVNADWPVPPSDSCWDAPPFCESFLNGYCSVNDFYTADDPGVLSCQIENNQWLSFIACAEEVVLEIFVENCLAATGLEISILETTDCQSFTTYVDCEVGADGDTAIITAPGLVPGNRYLLMVDGIGGDICQWQVLNTLGVSDGPTFQEENTPGQVEGPTSACLDQPLVLTYTFTGPICELIPLGGCPPASQLVCQPHLDTCFTYEYDTVWHVEPPGLVSFENNDSTGASVNIIVSDTIDIPPGGTVNFTVFVDPFHLVGTPVDTFECFDNCLFGCAEIIPDDDECKVLPLEVTLCGPDIIEEFYVICPGECVETGGEVFCSPGTYAFSTEDQCGCQDSFIVHIEEEFINPSPFVSSVVHDCAPDGLSYSVTLEFVNFGFWDVYVDGQFAIGGTYTVSDIPSGSTYEFDIEYVDWFCGMYYGDSVSGSHDCPCVPQTFDEGTITLCPGDCYDLAGNVYCDPGNYEVEVTNPLTGCNDTYIFTLENIDEAALASGPVTELCDAVNLEYTVTFTITDGVEPYFVNGGQIAGNLYQSASIPSGDSYVFLITDSGQCGDDEIILTGAYTCDCTTDPGTVSSALLSDCEDNMVSAEWNNDGTLDGNDILVFILHTGAGPSLGTILGTNVTGTFGFVPGMMEFGVTYYISAVAGDDTGGNVDLDDACLGVSPGQPVVFYENPQVDILPPGEITCDLPAVPLDAFPTGGSGQFSFAWSGPGLSGAGASVFANQSGIYTCVLTDDLSGCTAEASVTVEGDSDPPVFQIIPPNDVLTCAVTEVEISVTSSQPDLVYEWTLPGGGTASGTTISANEAGAYTVVATALNGCTSEEGTGVSSNYSPPENVQAAGEEITCDDPLATLTGSSLTSGVTFEWVSPSGNILTGATVTTDEAGAYTLVVTGTNGCTAETTATVPLDVLPPANIAAAPGELTCDQPAATLNATSSTPNVEFSWIFPTGNESMGASVTTDIPGQYTIIATGENGCTSQTTTNVTDLTDPPENVSATSSELTCLEPTAILEASSTTFGVTFTWIFPTGEEVEGDQISTNVPGDYVLIATASNGCTAEVQPTVTDLTDPPENLTVTNGEINCDIPVPILEASSTTPDVAFLWFFPNGDMADGPTVSAAEPGDYQLIATAPNGCTAEATGIVTVDTELPGLTVNSGELNCAQPEVALVAESGTPDLLYIWTLPNGSNVEGATLNASFSGIYEITVEAPNGCTATATTEVTDVPDPELVPSLLIERPTCAGDSDGSVTLETIAGGTEPYTLTLDGEPFENGIFENLPMGLYTLVITDANGCTDEEMVQVPQPPTVEVSLGEDQFVISGSPVVLNIETDISPTSIEWAGPNGQVWSGLSSLTVPATTNGTFEVTIADKNGCPATASVQIFVEGEGTVFIPNAFSPNGDEVNDIFTVFSGNDAIRVQSFSIFDRWGDMVFHDEDFPPHTTDTPPTRGWDGTLNGKPLDPAVFVFMAEVEFITGEVKMISGDVTLVR